jgi:hypothetical protein
VLSPSANPAHLLSLGHSSGSRRPKNVNVIPKLLIAILPNFGVHLLSNHPWPKDERRISSSSYKLVLSPSNNRHYFLIFPLFTAFSSPTSTIGLWISAGWTFFYAFKNRFTYCTSQAAGFLCSSLVTTVKRGGGGAALHNTCIPFETEKMTDLHSKCARHLHQHYVQLVIIFWISHIFFSRTFLTKFVPYSTYNSTNNWYYKRLYLQVTLPELVTTEWSCQVRKCIMKWQLIQNVIWWQLLFLISTLWYQYHT